MERNSDDDERCSHTIDMFTNSTPHEDTMGRSSKQKGSAYERRVVADLQNEGIVAMRIPLSGAMAGYKGDIKIDENITAEVKARKEARGFKKVRDWLGDNDVLLLQEIAKVGHGPSPKSLAVLPWENYIETLRNRDTLRKVRHIMSDTFADDNDRMTALQKLLAPAEPAPFESNDDV